MIGETKSKKIPLVVLGIGIVAFLGIEDRNYLPDFFQFPVRKEEAKGILNRFRKLILYPAKNFWVRKRVENRH